MSGLLSNVRRIKALRIGRSHTYLPDTLLSRGVIRHRPYGRVGFSVLAMEMEPTDQDSSAVSSWINDAYQPLKWLQVV